MITNTNPKPTTLLADLKLWLQRHTHLSGARVLLCLIKYANMFISVEMLDYLIHSKREVEYWPEYNDAWAYGIMREADYEMCDQKYLHQCKSEFMAASEEYQHCYELGDYTGAEKQKLIMEEVNRYLKQVWNPKSKTIKNFPPSWAKSQKLVYEAVRYTLDRVMRAERPDLAQYVDQHLKRGKALVWRDPEDEDWPLYSYGAHWVANERY